MDYNVIDCSPAVLEQISDSLGPWHRLAGLTSAADKNITIGALYVIEELPERLVTQIYCIDRETLTKIPVNYQPDATKIIHCYQSVFPFTTFEECFKLCTMDKAE